jgi:molecular chaperone Hsp33
MSERDSLRSFLFEHLAIRGEIVHLDATWQEALGRHEYPQPLRNLLGEMMAAAALLTGTLKFDGVLSMQLQGSGPVTLGVVECTSERRLRGLIRWEGDLVGSGLADLVGKGHMVITLEQRATGERYQGIVDISGDSLAQALEHYLHTSEQLETRLWLAANANSAAGMLLQCMPSTEHVADEDAWPRLTQLADTIQDEELLELDAEAIIHRLFHEETVRLFDVEPVGFHCSCSRERVQNTLRMLGHDEMRSVLAEQGEVSVHCEFCNQHYRFDAVDIEVLFTEGVVSDAPEMPQ